MRRGLAAVAAGVVCLGLAVLAAPAQAGSGIQRFSVSFDEEPSTMAVAGLGRGCPDVTGTLTEWRHLDIDGFVQPDGSAHARTVATAAVSLTPDDPAAPSYTGGYTQRQTGSFTNGGDDDRVVSTTTHGTITGSDGSSYKISEVVHFSVDASGTVRARFDRFHCE